MVLQKEFWILKHLEQVNVCVFENDVGVWVFVLQAPVFVFKQLRKNLNLNMFLFFTQNIVYIPTKTMDAWIFYIQNKSKKNAV